ncbi:MAG: hypothetical protein AAFO89_11690 [Planctomycetota bacterium]
MNRLATALAGASVCVVPGVAYSQVVTSSVFGDSADYEIRRDLLTGDLQARDGSATVLDVAEDFGFDELELRAIFQFDFATLADTFLSIDSAELVFTLESVDVLPSNDLDLWGSSDNRDGVVTDASPAATDEFDAASYAKLADNIAPISNPFDTDIEYAVDLTAFITDRYSDFQASPGESVVFLRGQMDQVIATSFFNIYSGDAAGTLRPRIDITGTIPAPGTAALLASGGLLIVRRRR